MATHATLNKKSTASLASWRGAIAASRATSKGAHNTAELIFLVDAELGRQARALEAQWRTVVACLEQRFSVARLAATSRGCPAEASVQASECPGADGTTPADKKKKQRRHRRKKKVPSDVDVVPGTDGGATVASTQDGAARGVQRVLAVQRSASRSPRGSTNRAPSSPPSAEMASLQFQPGDRVCVHGLCSRTELVGSSGIILMYYTATARYGVKIDGSGEQIAVKEERLRKSIFG